MKLHRRRNRARCGHRQLREPGARLAQKVTVVLERREHNIVPTAKLRLGQAADLEGIEDRLPITLFFHAAKLEDPFGIGNMGFGGRLPQTAEVRWLQIGIDAETDAVIAAIVARQEELAPEGTFLFYMSISEFENVSILAWEQYEDDYV